MHKRTMLLLLAAAGCSNDKTDTSPIVADGGTADSPAAPDAGEPDGGTATTLPDAPPATMVTGTLAGAVVLGSGDFVDVSTDSGGNIWAVKSDSVHFWNTPSGDGIAFNQANGLAHGQTTWSDPYWNGTPQNPAIVPVTFTSVAGGNPGQAYVGNIGFIGDRLNIDPATGAIQTLVGLEVTSAQQTNPDELVAQQVREVATLRAVVDLNGPGNGAVYFGGFHGTSMLRSMNLARTSGTCACFDFEEHVHPFSDTQIFGTDVRGLAVTPEGDLWMADRRGTYWMPMLSIGPNADFFDATARGLIGVPGSPGTIVDVFPGDDDYTTGIALDASGGVYVASSTHGLAYLAPGSFQPAAYWSSANVLPSDLLDGVAVDPGGDVWIATHRNGVVRYTPATNTWTSYTTGLPSPIVRAVYVDKSATGGARRVLFATGNGVAVYTGP